MTLISLLILAALAADPPTAATTSASQAAEAQAQVAPAPAKPPKPKKICVEEARIGSLMTHRICATQEEWDRRQERDAAEMAKMRSVPNAQ
jgi:hypothetical protein